VGASVGADVVGASVGADVVGDDVVCASVGVSVGADVVGADVGADVVGASVGVSVGAAVGDGVGAGATPMSNVVVVVAPPLAVDVTTKSTEISFPTCSWSMVRGEANAVPASVIVVVPLSFAAAVMVTDVTSYASSHAVPAHDCAVVNE
jgi:hypothetical protein